MSDRATYYLKRSRRETRNVRSDLAAKQYAGRNGFDAIRVESDTGTRGYVLTQSEGRLWHGPYNQEGWEHRYFDMNIEAEA